MHHRPVQLLAILLALVGLSGLALARAQPQWTREPDVQRRLAGGEVVVETVAEPDHPDRPHGRIRAAVLIQASPEAIWKVMTDCRETLEFVPGLKSCRRVDGAADGHWEDFEQEMHYAWYLPVVRYVFRADYDRPRRIDFHRLSGDLKEEEGTWVLTPTEDGVATVVEYEMYVDPGFWIPHALLSHTLRKDAPAVLAGLRKCVQRPLKASSE
jgi:uncharacterized protein YndB with AHSA1/START domain